MQYQGVFLLFILLLKSHFTEESGYNCSDFYDGYGEPLVECPPAKFMLKDHLLECFSNTSKSAQGRLYTLFENENERQKTNPVPIPHPKAYITILAQVLLILVRP